MRIWAKVEIPDILASKVAVVVNVSTCWLEMQKSGSAVWHLPKKALECEQRRLEYIFGPHQKFQMLLLRPTILEAYVLDGKLLIFQGFFLDTFLTNQLNLSWQFLSFSEILLEFFYNLADFFQKFV